MGLIPAYAVDGGRINAAMLRTVLWASTSGASGIVRATDLRVSALAVPGTKVNINPGAALLANRFSGSSGTQSYAAASDGVTQLDIPATGSSGGRTDFIILRIDDWHFTGAQAPVDPVNALYCSFQRVSSLTGLNYPYVALAKIVIPASTGTITNAMITDLRKVALPRTERVVRVNAMVIPETETVSNATTGEYFPNAGGAQTVSIPPWATRVKIRATWHGMVMPGGNCQGRMWVSFGDWDGKSWGAKSQEFAWDNVANANTYRLDVSAVDDMPVPPALRGRDVRFQMWGRKLSSTSVGARMDQNSGATLDLLFEEIADSSDS